MKFLSKNKFINFLILSIIIFFLILVVWYPTFWFLKKIVKPIIITQSYDTRIDLPNKNQYQNVEQFFQEQSNLLYVPRSFIMYEPQNFEGEFINIGKIYGESFRKSLGDENDATIWFFGGSALFGDSSPDLKTIPSYFQNITKKNVINFGVGAYNSRQNLNKYLNLLKFDKKPEIIFFYDGINNLVANCSTSIDYIPQQYRENELVEKLNLSGNPRNNLRIFFEPYIYVIEKFKLIDPIINLNKCIKKDVIDIERIKLIAKNNCDDWSSAKLIAEARGAKFYGVLQPHLWSSPKHLSSHLVNNKNNLYQKKIYKTYYEYFKSICKKQIKEYFLDLSISLDGSNYYFVDSVHVSPLGNKKLAKAIADKIK